MRRKGRTAPNRNPPVPIVKITGRNHNDAATRAVEMPGQRSVRLCRHTPGFISWHISYRMMTFPVLLQYQKRETLG